MGDTLLGIFCGMAYRQITSVWFIVGHYNSRVPEDN